MRVAANGVQSAKHLMKRIFRPRQATKCMALEVAGRSIMIPIMITTAITLTKTVASLASAEAVPASGAVKAHHQVLKCKGPHRNIILDISITKQPQKTLPILLLL
jgi:hypothetical protein